MKGFFTSNDPTTKMNAQKKHALGSIIICACLSPVFTVIICMLVYFLSDRVKKKIMNAILAGGLILCLTWMLISGYTIFELLLHPFTQSKSLLDYIIWLNPMRVTVGFIAGIIYYKKEDIIWRNTAEMQIFNEVQQRLEKIPDGDFDFEDNGHLLAVGTTGAGKTLFLKFLMQYFISTGRFLVVVSAKLAGTDPYSMLEHAKMLAKKYRRKLYIISMDPKHNGTAAYNPFNGMTWDSIRNVMKNLIHFSEEHYGSNFVMWMYYIYKALKLTRTSFNLKRVVSLYDYEDYEDYLNKKIEEYKQNGKNSGDLERLLKSRRAKKYAKIAEESEARVEELFAEKDYLLKGDTIISIKKAYAENAIIFFDLNGNSAAEATRAMGAMITGELQQLISECKDTETRKGIIFDEISYYTTDLMLPLYNLSRSAGFQCIAATQSWSDLDKISPFFRISMVENSNQYAIFRQNAPENADLASRICGTVLATELTKKIAGLKFSEEGSSKVVDIMPAHPNIIKTLPTAEMIYITKKDSGRAFESHVSRVTWSPEDLEKPGTDESILEDEYIKESDEIKEETNETSEDLYS